MTFLAFILTPLQSIPNGLTPRFDAGNTIIGVILFIAFMTIALVRMSKSSIYASLIVANSKVGGLRAFIKESMPLNKLGSGLLLFNYLLSSSAMLYLFCIYKNMDWQSTSLIITLVPLAFFAWTIISLFLTRSLVGVKDVFYEPLILKIIGAQFLGLIYFCLALTWMLNTNYSLVFINLMIWAFIIESIFRILKSIILVFSKGVPLYYIILYFCTLEILPLVVAYFALSK